jgi:hypothetical protein
MDVWVVTGGTPWRPSGPFWNGVIVHTPSVTGDAV